MNINNFINTEKENKIIFGIVKNDKIVNEVVPLMDMSLDTYNDFKQGNIKRKLSDIKIRELFLDISKKLSKRFGFKIDIKNFNSKDKIIEAFTTNTDYENIYAYKNELIENNVTDFLSFIKDSNKVTKSKESLKSIIKELDTDGVNVDVNNNKIIGLNLFLDVFINLDNALLLNLTPSELGSLVFYEIGRVFVNTQNLYKQVHLASLVSSELIDKNLTIENIKIVSEKYLEKNITETEPVYVFNDLVVNYQDKAKDIFNKETEMEEGIKNFITNFNLDNDYINALTKINNESEDIKYYSLKKEITDIFIVGFITIVMSVVFLTFAFLLVPAVLTMGVFKMAFSFLIIIVKIFLNLIKFLFGKSFEGKTDILKILNEVKAFKRIYISRIRKATLKEERENILIKIKYLDYLIEKYSKILKYEKDKRIKETNEMNKDYKINKLKDNDLQYLSEEI